MQIQVHLDLDHCQKKRFDVRCLQAIVTELVFEHALRIRMKEERLLANSSSTQATPESSSTLIAPDQSDSAQESIGEDTSATLPASEETTPTPPLRANKKNSENPDSNYSLVGKINNLISSDLENITDLTELPRVMVHTPLKIGLSVWFLYALLGWRYVPVESIRVVDSILTESNFVL